MIMKTESQNVCSNIRLLVGSLLWDSGCLILRKKSYFYKSAIFFFIPSEHEDPSVKSWGVGIPNNHLYELFINVHLFN